MTMEFLKNLKTFNFKDWFLKNVNIIIEILFVIWLCYIFYLWGYESALTEVINDVGGLQEFCMDHFVGGSGIKRNITFNCYSFSYFIYFSSTPRNFI